MFGKIAKFELRYQLTSPTFWVAFGIFFILAFAAMTSSNITIGGGGNTLYNAPVAIIMTMLVMSFFVLFAGTAFVANIIVRDDETGFGPIIHSAPVSKSDYLFGRFLGAFVALAIVFAAVPAGTLLGTLMPWVDAVKLGPFRPMDYIYGYFFFCLPTLFLISAALFAFTTMVRTMTGAYLGVVGILVLYMVMNILFRDPQNLHIAALLDPFGIKALSEALRYWTAADRNTMLPPWTGDILYNRLIWSGVALCLLAAAHVLYSPVRKRRNKKVRKAEATTPETSLPEAPMPVARALPAPRFDRTTRLRQAWAWTRFEFGQVFRSPGFFILMAIGLFNATGSLWYATDTFGFTVFPVTRLMISALGSTFQIMTMIIAIFYAGELVWRERNRHTHEIIDASPLPDLAFILPKIAAIVLVLLSAYAISAVAAIIVQAIHGYTRFEISHYLLWYILPSLAEVVELAILSLFVQVLAPHKYVGWAVMAVFLIAQMYLAQLGFDNNLYNYGDSSAMPLSDMNGAGRFWIGKTWFHVYWLAFAAIMVMLSYGLWRRGSETRYRPRLKQLMRRMRGPAGAVTAVFAVLFIGSGIWCFYNTVTLNHYQSPDAQRLMMANYEKTLLPLKKLPEPKIADVKLNVAIWPDQTRADTTGSYRIVNRTDKVLHKMLVHWPHDLDMRHLTVDGAKPSHDYGEFHTRMYAFTTPMQPGESRMVHFTTTLEERGFDNGTGTTRIVRNGSFLTNSEIAPGFGINQGLLLSDPVKRRKYGLPSFLRPPKLEDDSARAYNYLGHDADWVRSDITVSTVAGQVPVAPGYAVSDVTKGGRHMVRFRSKSPIMNFFSIQSAAYRVKHRNWNGVDLAVYYDPHTPYEVDRMLKVMQTALSLYQKDFSPFQFRQMRILEFPDYAGYAQSFANTVPFSEGMGFIQDDRAVLKNPKKIDMITYVTAHELGHQWWAHQVIGADMQGDTMLSESFAQYSAMLTMRHIFGPDRVRGYLKYTRDRYLNARGSEEIEELPLNRVENQPYIHYYKGALVMYRLMEAVGEDTVNRAMQRLLKQYAFKGAPYPKSTDFIKILREEAGPKYDALITDLFEKITIYDLRAKSETARKRRDGKWDVALTVEAHKYYADGKGKETETPLNEKIDVGAFTEKPDSKGFGKKDVLAYTAVPVKSGTQVLHFIATQKPETVGIDPYDIWIDRNSHDNLT